MHYGLAGFLGAIGRKLSNFDQTFSSSFNRISLRNLYLSQSLLLRFPFFLITYDRCNFLTGRYWEIPKGTLEIKSEPNGAKVWIDGKDAGVTPYIGSIVAGEEHSVIVSEKGYKFNSQKVNVQQGGKEVLSVVLEELKAGEMGAPTIIGKDGAEMILIPAGEFIMGSSEGEGDDDEHPQHTVFLDVFYIDKYEVTNAQYKQFMDATGHKAPAYWEDEKYNQPKNSITRSVQPECPRLRSRVGLLQSSRT